MCPAKKSSSRSSHGTAAGASAAALPTSHGGLETTNGVTIVRARFDGLQAAGSLLPLAALAAAAAGLGGGAPLRSKSGVPFGLYPYC